ncbi:MAG: ZIP family metal transporter [Patescibacteria group bacterium]|nr:ZIP family metal transporter [Patescibacteria group bacterium]
MTIWLYTIASVVIVSLISLVGIFFLSLNKERLQKILLYLVSFAVGGLFGDAFIHLLPQAFQSETDHLLISLLILAGICLFFILEKVVRWRHCHIPNSKTHIHPVVPMNLIGDGLHNLTDGMIIAASYSLDFSLGLATTLAVILHEIPQEIGDFGVLVYGGLSVKKAVIFNFLSASTAILGAVIALLVGSVVAGFSSIILPIAAGGFIYIAGADLIPELHHEFNPKTSIKQLMAIISGIGIMATLLIWG